MRVHPAWHVMGPKRGSMSEFSRNMEYCCTYLICLRSCTGMDVGERLRRVWVVQRLQSDPGRGAMMRHRRGSMCKYVQRDDLEPRARCGGAPARQAGGAATRAAQPPQPHNPSNSQHTATAHPRRLLGSAPNSVEISSIGGTMDPQRIGVLRSLDPRQSLNTFISGYKAPTACAGIPASNKHYPQQGLVPAGPPCKLERRPTSHAASPGPRAKYRDRVTTADRPIRVP